MNTIIKLLVVFLLPISSLAADKTTFARITKIESWVIGSVPGVHLWLERVNGDQLPTGNSGHFNQGLGTRLILAEGSSEVDARKHMLSTALTAYSMGQNVWFYWSDADGKIRAIMPVQ